MAEYLLIGWLGALFVLAVLMMFSGTMVHIGRWVGKLLRRWKGDLP